MRKIICSILCIALMLSLTSAFAAVSGDEALTYEGPILITNAGQGPGGKMARLLMGQTGTITLDTDFFYDSEPGSGAEGHITLDDLANYNALMVVIGSTDKGLGASGITIEDELARLEKMVAKAKELEVPIIAVLLEQDKRSTISTNANERCIDCICPNADWMIVVANGNTDDRFDAIKAETNAPLTVLDTTLDFTELCKTAFLPVGAAPAA